MPLTRKTSEIRATRGRQCRTCGATFIFSYKWRNRTTCQPCSFAARKDGKRYPGTPRMLAVEVDRRWALYMEAGGIPI